MPRKTRVEFPGAVYHLICRDSKIDPFSSSDGGTYTITQPRTIVVATATSGCNLRYTLNGATPTQTIGTLIASGGTVTVTPSPGGTVLKVIAYKTGWTDSTVHSATYYYEGEGGPSPTVAPTATATATPTATATATATPTAPAAAAATATATATPASQVSTPTFNPDGGTWFITQQRTVTVTTSTMGANMRYTINGAPPTSTTGTLISGSSWPVTVTPSPLGTTLRVIAYKAGMIDSQVHEAVFYYENDNGGNSNMAQPIDGGPGGGGILIDGGDQSTLSYDANGNLISYKAWVYHYDAQNRLTYASNGTTSATFYYDGKNRQIARNVNGVIRFSAWDGWELLEEYSSSLNVVTGYLQGTTGVIKSWSAANTLYYYQDKLGSTTHVANAIGQLVESYHYDLTGTPSYFNSTSQPINSSTVGAADLYAGERWIPELALYDLRNRFMSPELGRFLETDPIGFHFEGAKLTPGQKAFFFGGEAPEAFSNTELNLHRYCHNDPVNNSDPFGLEFFPYNGPVTEVDQLYGGAGLGQTRVVTPVSVVSQADGTYTLRLDVRITGIAVAERVKFHGKMITRSEEQKRVTGEEHERGEHTKDWRGFHDRKQSEVPSTRYKDPQAAGAAAKAHQEKVEGEARKARNEFEKHQPDERWKNIRDRELPH